MHCLPKISVVIPNLNQSSFLKSCLDSIFNQHYPALEVIVIDGGSSDGSLDIIKQRSAQLAYWISESDKGQYDAVEKGFRKSTGDILSFLNSDDIYIAGALWAVGTIFASNPQVRWLSSLWPVSINSENTCTGVTMLPGFNKLAFQDGEFNPLSLTKRSAWFIQQESTFWRRELWIVAGGGFDKAFTLAGDFDLWSRFYVHTNLVGVASLLGAFRIRAGQRSDNHPVYNLECEQSLMRHQQGNNPFRRQLSSIWRLSKMARRFRRLLKLSGLYEAEYVLFDHQSNNWRLAHRLFDW